MTSVSFTVTVVVPDNPPRCPPMSLAWRTTRYSSRLSRSMSGTAVRRMPGRRKTQCHRKKQTNKKNTRSARFHSDKLSLEISIKVCQIHTFSTKDAVKQITQVTSVLLYQSAFFFVEHMVDKTQPIISNKTTGIYV